MKKFILGLIMGILITIPVITYSAPSLASKLMGKILLAVEDQGKTYYVHEDGYRYRVTTATAQKIFEKLALGITNKNLEQIPEKNVDIDVEAEVLDEEKQAQGQKTTELNNGTNINVTYIPIGTEAQNKTFNFKINSVEIKQTITGAFGNKTAKENAQFVVVDMSITNTTNSKYMFLPEKSFINEEGFYLLDEKERRYETYDGTYRYINNFLNQRYLSPSLTERGYLVYEVPNDAGIMALATVNVATGECYAVGLQ